MDEGRPTKAKWWSRPRQGSPGPTHQPPAAEPERPAAGQTEAFPQGPAQAEAGPAVPVQGTPATGTGRPAAGQTEAFPQGPAQAEAGPAVPVQGTPATGTGRPAAGQTEAFPQGPAQAEAGLAVPAQGTPATGTALPAGLAQPAQAERPLPLHDPDPYSTPPYGEPGPWAPAPPVQHPAATPARGTTLPAAPQSGTPPHGTQGPAPLHGTTPPPPGAAAPAPYGGAPQPGQPQAAQGAPRQPYDPWNQPLQQIGSLPPETREKQRKRARRLVVVGVALIALVSGLIGGALGSYLERNGVDEIELPQADAESADRPRGSVAGIAAAALPGVVTLHVSGDSAQGTGTGFVLDGKGHILTNNHVVEPAGTGGEITVTFSGGDTAEAEVIGRDSGYDLAVVKVSHVRGLKPLTLGNSENVQVGDPVVAIGAPFDLANTVTSGIISAKERPITAGGEKGDGSDISYVDALQTDAPINPGNSGGPLVDSKARVIGINSAIRSAGDGSDMKGGQAGSIGLGFAIPINQGKRVAEELINFGKATHPVIGVTLDTDFTGDGARIADKGKDGGPAVNTNGPGDKAGLKPGDVITEVDGAPVHSSDELIVKVRAHRPKDRLDLTIGRGGRDREVTLVLGSADGD
ncbi:S1C family serine protease [Streptomyces sp. KN37]|uniref:S1C family serine protease n=1 Tax=Streptomyces sp. KN37 TaxID=3090667 RepID=UPI002A74990E|nr:trypsin-like peptidase domain-containing protein [Streptomyces sp. KN37]WPO71598.1 trypsin-like peptidase domain-containing protein [Streptomyces sp. KN37]